MFNLFRYRLMRHIPIKKIKDHYERNIGCIFAKIN